MRIFLLFSFILIVNILNGQDKVSWCEGYLIDPDTTGTNIRKQPSGEIIAKIKNRDSLGNPEIHAFEIIGSQGNWLNIRIDFLKLEGFIYNELVGTTLKRGKIKIYKSTDSDFVDIVDMKDFDFEIKILDCKFLWIRTEFSYKNKNYSGWIKCSDTCSNPYTTCG